MPAEWVALDVEFDRMFHGTEPQSVFNVEPHEGAAVWRAPLCIQVGVFLERRAAKLIATCSSSQRYSSVKANCCTARQKSADWPGGTMMTPM